MKIETFLQQTIEQPTKVDEVPLYRVAWKLTLTYLKEFVNPNTAIIVRIFKLGLSLVQNGIFAAVLWAIICAVLPKAIFFSHSPLVTPLLILLYIVLLVISPYCIFFYLAVTGHATYLSEQRRKKTIAQRYGGSVETLRFSDAAYAAAARALETWNDPMYIDTAVKKFSQESVDICILAGAVSKYNSRYERVVSLNAIREDREAGWED